MLQRFALCIVAAFPLAALSQIEGDFLKVKVHGTAQGNGSAARAEAIHDAERQALVLAVKSLLGEEYTELAAALDKQTDRYVQTSRLVESEAVDGATRALVEVYIRNQQLRSDVAGAIFPHINPRPTALILVAEEVAGETFLNAAAIGVVETQLVAAFQSSGFSVVDGARLRESYAAPELLRYVQGPPELAARFGLENRADVVVLGIAISAVEQNGSSDKLPRIEAETTIRIVRAIDGAVVNTRRNSAGVHAVNPADGARLALRDAAVKARQGLLVDAALAMVGVLSNENYTMTIESPGSREFLRAIEDQLGAVPELSHLQELRMSAEQAVFQFRYHGKLRPLVDSLTEMQYPGYALEPSRIVERELVFKTVPREN